MARIEAIVAGTGVIPSYGKPLLDEHDLRRLADQLTGSSVPMLIEHDLDQPVDVVVVRTEIRDGPEGDRQLFVEYEVPDEQAAAFEQAKGMSIGFSKWLIAPDDGEADASLCIDPSHFDNFELAVAVRRLNRGGFTPAGGIYLQLAVEPPPTVVFDFLLATAQAIGWGIITNAIYDGLKILLHRDHKTHFRFRIHKDATSVTAEVETSSEAGLKEALKALRDLDIENDGLFVRESRKWRKAGTGKRARAGTRRLGKEPRASRRKQR